MILFTRYLLISIVRYSPNDHETYTPREVKRWRRRHTANAANQRQNPHPATDR